MAEAWAKGLSKPDVDSWSAGSEPGETVNPNAVTVMGERGISLEGFFPKGLQAVPAPIDMVVTLCDNAAQSCPTFPGARAVQHWGLPDPADATGDEAQILEVFRASRDDIERRVRELLGRLDLLAESEAKEAAQVSDL